MYELPDPVMVEPATPPTAANEPAPGLLTVITVEPLGHTDGVAGVNVGWVTTLKFTVDDTQLFPSV